MSRQTSFNLFPSKNFIQILYYVYTVRNTKPCHVRHNWFWTVFSYNQLCKPPKNFDFLEAEQVFRYFWFEEFPWGSYSLWEDRTIACLVFYSVVKMWESLQKKPYSSKNSGKNIQKTSKCSNGNTQKEANIVS